MYSILTKLLAVSNMDRLLWKTSYLPLILVVVRSFLAIRPLRCPIILCPAPCEEIQPSARRELPQNAAITIKATATLSAEKGDLSKSNENTG